MDIFYNLFSGMGTQRQSVEAQALEQISHYQRDRIRELELKRMEIDREIEQAKEVLDISESRAGSVEPRSLLPDRWVCANV
jgi:hypothetical protein